MSAEDANVARDAVSGKIIDGRKVEVREYTIQGQRGHWERLHLVMCWDGSVNGWLLKLTLHS